jgi:hypothetical protein
MVRWPALCAIVAILASRHTLAFAATGESASTGTDTPPATSEETEGKTWSFSVSAYTYFVPEDTNFVVPVVTADRGRLHLEARYNYEDHDTGSAWVGYNLRFGKSLTWDITPMVGAVFGKTNGVAPGYKSTLSWWKLELYSEGEYVIDANDTSDSFFYTWSELSLAPLDWFRFGLVVQRTKLYETDFDIQRGFLAGFSYKRVAVTAYVFHPDESRPTVVLGIGLGY